MMTTVYAVLEPCDRIMNPRGSDDLRSVWSTAEKAERERARLSTENGYDFIVKPFVIDPEPVDEPPLD